MTNFYEYETTAAVYAGAEITHCCMEAAIIALTEKHIFRFNHNGRIYIANPKDLISLVLNTGKKVTENE